MKSRIVDGLGPAIQHPPVAACASLSDEIFGALHRAREGHERKGETGREHLLTRFLYLAESTSTGVRMNASWTLILPAMSLLRDRYEQVVRFSWLSRQINTEEIVKFLDHYHARSNAVFGNLSAAQWVQLEGVMAMKPERPSKLSKLEKEHLSRWEKLDLRSMAIKRDKVTPKTSSPIEGQTLADLYTPIYQHFSSVSHGDAFGLDMLRLQKSPTDTIILAPDPWWPAFLCLFNSLFDLIQCHEAVSAFPKRPQEPKFDGYLTRWLEVRDKILIASPD